jgi:hypothetical protein
MALLTEEGIQRAQHRLPPINDIRKITLVEPAIGRHIIREVEQAIVIDRHLTEPALAVPDVRQLDRILSVVGEPRGEMQRGLPVPSLLPSTARKPADCKAFTTVSGALAQTKAAPHGSVSAAFTDAPDTASASRAASLRYGLVIIMSPISVFAFILACWAGDRHGKLNAYKACLPYVFLICSIHVGTQRAGCALEL